MSPLATRPFELVRPAAGRAPVVVEVPHAGLLVDAEAASTLVAPARSLARDADLFVDELVSHLPAVGVTLLVARASRYLIDLNRGPADVDAAMVVGGRGTGGGHGLVWTRTSDGAPALDAPLPRSELDRRVAQYHAPYHAALAETLDELRREHGHVVLLCAHSMPSDGVGVDGRVRARADVVPGSRGRTSADTRLLDAVDAVCGELNLSVRHDDPYRGGYSTTHYGRPKAGVHAVQIEVARRLYMNEDRLSRVERGVARVRGFYSRLVERVGAPSALA
ncbi:MAG: N-formylglutamate amidohydrolase [Polyangiaceae bacterium]|nr:N-formylglutamate amidohydrolase [Polyangiaceae bacterium]